MTRPFASSVAKEYPHLIGLAFISPTPINAMIMEITKIELLVAETLSIK